MRQNSDEKVVQQTAQHKYNIQYVILVSFYTKDATVWTLLLTKVKTKTQAVILEFRNLWKSKMSATQNKIGSANFNSSDNSVNS